VESLGRVEPGQALVGVALQVRVVQRHRQVDRERGGLRGRGRDARALKAFSLMLAASYFRVTYSREFSFTFRELLRNLEASRKIPFGGFPNWGIWNS
jgi:hypothetical protein